MAEQRPLHGRKLGDRRVVVDRPHARYFRYLGPGVLEAKLEAQAPRTAYQRRMAYAQGRALRSPAVIGRGTDRAPAQVEGPAGLLVGRDVLGGLRTGAMMLILAGAGSDSFKYVLPLSVVVVALLVIVTFSYRQTIRAYPNGGGSYIVAHANLGVLAGLTAAGSLLTDYVLTVAVSVSSGVQALYSAFPALQPWAVPLIAFSILLVMVVNLRGLRESGTLFASPTYIFIGSMLIMIAVGVFRSLTGQLPQVDRRGPADRRRHCEHWASSCSAGPSPMAARP